ASFKTKSGLGAGEFQRACNALLPPAIRIVATEEMGPDFHARWKALAKTYQYRIYRGKIVPPFEWRYVLHHPWPLDEAALSEAARHFEGEHDFTAFAAAPDRADEGHDRAPLREIFSSEIERDASGEELRYTIRGRSFMRHMVRKIVGTLLDVGRGKLTPQDIPGLFEMKDRSKSGMTVPPTGLCMMSVEYPDPADSLGTTSARIG
ncbi:MAG: tRNA pseudouridine synthase A, partial [Acidobacteria bacterium]|nr:tRNA pseudouridine synthase A [Acidobacteriota bacterium]